MKNERARRRKYFREAQWKIAEDNLRILMWTAVITVGLLLLFLLLAKWMLPGWHIAACHMAFFPVLLVFCGVVAWYRRRNVVSRQASAVLSVLFECIVFSFVILIDTVGTPGGPGSFMPVVCVAIPAILTLPHILSYGLMGIFEVVYIAAALVWKEPAVRWYDIFGSLVGVICSMAVENLVMSLRIRDYEARMQYKQLSTKDALSDVFNKKASIDAARQYLRDYNPRVTCALIMLDLDDFKEVNDTHGHYTGDIVLGCTGQVLLNAFRSTDIVGRFGGDEFMVLVKGTAAESLLEEKCRVIQRNLQKLSLEKSGVQVSCSIGVVLVQEQEVDFEVLFRQADAALYHAKSVGKARHILQSYTPVGLYLKKAAYF